MKNNQSDGIKVFKVVMFASLTAKGKELALLLRNELETLFNSSSAVSNVKHTLEMATYYPGDIHYNPIFLYRYQKTADVVIFDASIEEDAFQKIGANYDCTLHAPYFEKNVLVVSRTTLPLNYIPHTTNVLPFGEDYLFENGIITFVRSYDNKLQIIPWIKNQIEGFLITSDKGEKSNNQIGNSSVKKNPQLFLKNKEHVAFISYRSYYFGERKEGNDTISVLDLDYYIRKYHENEEWKVLYYPPGSLSQDCPTEDLRWSLVSYLENVFKYVDEVWIFETNAGDAYSYWDSWFTNGEFLSLMILNQSLKHRMPKVYLYNPHTKSHKVLDDLPRVSDELHYELSSLEINSDTLWGDRASMKKMVWTIENFENFGFFKRLNLKLGEVLVNWRNKHTFGFNKKTTLQELSALHVYSKGFLTNRIFGCPHCMIKGNTIDVFSDDSFVDNFIHVGNTEKRYTVRNVKNGIFVLSRDEFADALKLGYVECPNCGKRMRIIAAPEQSFYLWQRYLSGTPHKNDPLIEKVEAYNLCEYSVGDE